MFLTITAVSTGTKSSTAPENVRIPEGPTPTAILEYGTGWDDARQPQKSAFLIFVLFPRSVTCIQKPSLGVCVSFYIGCVVLAVGAEVADA
jgi:hypothetical protein